MQIPPTGKGGREGEKGSAIPKEEIEDDNGSGQQHRRGRQGARRKTQVLQAGREDGERNDEGTQKENNKVSKEGELSKLLIIAAQVFHQLLSAGSFVDVNLLCYEEEEEEGKDRGGGREGAGDGDGSGGGGKWISLRAHRVSESREIDLVYSLGRERRERLPPPPLKPLRASREAAAAAAASGGGAKGQQQVAFVADDDPREGRAEAFSSSSPLLTRATLNKKGGGRKEEKRAAFHYNSKYMLSRPARVWLQILSSGHKSAYLLTGS